jgi:hypothetical protein
MRRTAQASQVLQRKMESLRTLSWSQLQSLPGTFTDPSDTAGLFAGTIGATTLDSYSGAPTLMLVTLNVTYTSTAKVVTTSLTTAFSKGGLNKT